jgi:hypothetical protein
MYLDTRDKIIIQNSPFYQTNLNGKGGIVDGCFPNYKYMKKYGTKLVNSYVVRVDGKLHDLPTCVVKRS